jgi:hypothetical protein
MEPEGYVMPDLYSQIGALYKVIVQIDSASNTRRTERPYRWWRVSGRSICTCYCLWFSLPLSIWLSSGWIGLLFYWQVLSGAACLVEKFTRKQQPALAARTAGDTVAEYGAVAEYCPIPEYCPAEGTAR